MRDVFLPTNEPARSIYLALDKQIEKRKSYPGLEWIEAEREAVFREAGIQAQLRGLKAPTMEEVENAETGACGHTDYMAKFAYGVARVMVKL